MHFRGNIISEPDDLLERQVSLSVKNHPKDIWSIRHEVFDVTVFDYKKTRLVSEQRPSRSCSPPSSNFNPTDAPC